MNNFKTKIQLWLLLAAVFAGNAVITAMSDVGENAAIADEAAERIDSLAPERRMDQGNGLQRTHRETGLSRHAAKHSDDQALPSHAARYPDDQTLPRHEAIYSEDQGSLDQGNGLRRTHKEIGLPRHNASPYPKPSDGDVLAPTYTMPSKDFTPTEDTSSDTSLPDIHIKKSVFNRALDAVTKFFRSFKPSVQQASAIARTHATDGTVPTSTSSLQAAMKNLSTAEKEDVANQWVKARIQKIQELESTIKKESAKNNATFALHRQLQQEITNMDQDMQAFKDALQQTLSPHEYVLPIKGKLIKKASLWERITGSNTQPEESEFRAFEIVDMRKINPKNPIISNDAGKTTDQYKELVENGFIQHVSPKALEDAYASWVVRAIMKDPKYNPNFITNPSFDFHQAAADATGADWGSINFEIQRAISSKWYALVAEHAAKAPKPAPSADEPIAPAVPEPAAPTDDQPQPKPKPVDEGTLREEFYNRLTKMNTEEIKNLTEDEIRSTPTYIIRIILLLDAERLQAFPIDKLTNSQKEALTNSTGLNVNLNKLSSQQIRVLIAFMKPESIAILTTEQLANLSAGDINALKPEQMKALPIQKLTPDQLKDVTTDQLENINLSYLTKLSADQIKVLTPEQIKALTLSQVKVLTIAQLKALTDEQIKALQPSQLKVINANRFAAFTAEQLTALTPKQQQAITTAQHQKLNTEQQSAISL